MWLLAWDLCAAQVSEPAGFLGAGARLSSDPAMFRQVQAGRPRAAPPEGYRSWAAPGEAAPGPDASVERGGLLQCLVPEGRRSARGFNQGYVPLCDREPRRRRGRYLSATSAALVETLGEDGTPVKGKGKRPLKDGTPESRQLAHVQRENEGTRRWRRRPVTARSLAQPVRSEPDGGVADTACCYTGR